MDFIRKTLNTTHPNLVIKDIYRTAGSTNFRVKFYCEHHPSIETDKSYTSAITSGCTICNKIARLERFKDMKADKIDGFKVEFILEALEKNEPFIKIECENCGASQMMTQSELTLKCQGTSRLRCDCGSHTSPVSRNILNEILADIKDIKKHLGI